MSIITRASTKLVIVLNSGDTTGDTNAEEKAYKVKVTEQVERTLSYYIKQKVVLIGFIHDYMQFEDITSKWFEDSSSINYFHLPKVEGLRLLRRAGGKKVFQIDDLYRKEDIEELVKCGVEKLIILGDVENVHPYSVNFFTYTGRILAEVLGNVGTIFVFYSLFCLERNTSFAWNRFLHRYVQTSSDKLEQSAADILWRRKKEKLPTSGPVINWENWKQKAELQTCPDLTTKLNNRRDGYGISLFFLTRQRDAHVKQREFTSAIEDEKKMAKLQYLIGKSFLNHGLRELHESLEFDDFINYLPFSEATASISYGCRCFLSVRILSILSTIKDVLRSNPYLEEGNWLMRAAVSMLERLKFTLEDGNLQSLDQLTELDIETGEIPLFRSIKSGDFLQPDTNSDFYIDLNKIQIIEQKQIEYEQKIKTKKHQDDEMIECRKILADALSDLALENLTRICKSEIDISGFNEYWYFLISILENIGKYSIRYALKALDWNPHHEHTRNVFEKSSSLFTFVVQILIGKGIGEEHFFSNRLKALRSQITTLIPIEDGSHCSSSSKRTISFAKISQTEDSDLKNSGTDQKEKEDEVDTETEFFFKLIIGYIFIKYNFIVTLKKGELLSEQYEENDINGDITQLNSLVSAFNIRKDSSYGISNKVRGLCLLVFIIIFIIILIIVISNDVWGCYLLYIF